MLISLDLWIHPNIKILLTVDGHPIDYRRNWDILMQKSKLIIVLDTKACKQQLFSLLTMRGFDGIPEILMTMEERSQHFCGTEKIMINY